MALTISETNYGLLFLFSLLSALVAANPVPPEPTSAITYLPNATRVSALQQVSYIEFNTFSILRKRGDPDVLPPHYWRLAKNQQQIEEFRSKYNLTIVTASPQEAALLPSWPQALMQYLLLCPLINLSYVRNGREVGIWEVLQYIVAPPCLIAWLISFAHVQSTEKSTAGWISILGWATWLCFAIDVSAIALPSLIIALFQWCASLALLIQRWQKDIGTVAYQISDLNGCIPHDGLTYLEAGIRARPYRIIQTATFVVGSAYTCFAGAGRIKNSLNEGLALIGLAELIYSSVVAAKGMPFVVSGNCLLVELSPRLGYLDSDISTKWKALSGFMGF